MVEYRFVFKVWEVWGFMHERNAKHSLGGGGAEYWGFGSLSQHGWMSSNTYTDSNLISKAKGILFRKGWKLLLKS